MRTEAPEETPAVTPQKGRRHRRRGGSSGDGRFGQRILPRTVIGVVVLMLAAAIGFAFGGTVLYAYYQYKTDKLEKKVDKFVGGFEERFNKAVEDIDKEKEEAKEEVRKEIQPLTGVRGGGG